MDLTAILLTLIGGLVTIVIINLRNAAHAQAMINSRFDKMDGEIGDLRKENTDLRVEVSGLKAANAILTNIQVSERTMSDTRAEQQGELKARVSALTAANVTSRSESSGWQKLAEELRVEFNGFPKQIADLEAIVRRLGAGLPPKEAAGVEAEIADAKPDTVAANAPMQVEIVNPPHNPVPTVDIPNTA